MFVVLQLSSKSVTSTVSAEVPFSHATKNIHIFHLTFANLKIYDRSLRKAYVGKLYGKIPGCYKKTTTLYRLWLAGVITSAS